MAQRANISIDQGSIWSTVITITDDENEVVSLTGYTGNAVMRKAYSSLNVSATFNVSVNAQLGQITLSLTANQTSNLQGGRYVYDVKITDGSGNPSRIVEGIATVNPKVT